MKLRAKRDCQVPDQFGRPTYRRGPETDINDVVIEGGEVFEVADDFLVNLDVLEIVEHPKGRKARTFNPSPQTPAKVEAAG